MAASWHRPLLSRPRPPTKLVPQHAELEQSVVAVAAAQRLLEHQGHRIPLASHHGHTAPAQGNGNGSRAQPYPFLLPASPVNAPRSGLTLSGGRWPAASHANDVRPCRPSSPPGRTGSVLLPHNTPGWRSSEASEEAAGGWAVENDPCNQGSGGGAGRAGFPPDAANACTTTNPSEERRAEEIELQLHLTVYQAMMSTVEAIAKWQQGVHKWQV